MRIKKLNPAHCQQLNSDAMKISLGFKRCWRRVARQYKSKSYCIQHNFRVRRYATGDPFRLCRFHGGRESKTSQYKDAIIGLLTKNVLKKHILEQITELGYRGKRTAFEAYCRGLIAELNIPYMPKRNAAGANINPNPEKQPQRYILSCGIYGQEKNLILPI